MATLLLAGPCTATLFFILMALQRLLLVGDAGEWLEGAASMDALAILTVGASLTGLVGSLPATILNTAIQENLRRSHWDSWMVGAVAGGISGAMVIPTFLRPVIDLTELTGGKELTIAMGLASILMGLVYWTIAIRPR